jgi:hypothetical protein
MRFVIPTLIDYVKVIDLISQFSGLTELVLAIPLVYYTYRFILIGKTDWLTRGRVFLILYTYNSRS